MGTHTTKVRVDERHVRDAIVVTALDAHTTEQLHPGQVVTVTWETTSAAEVVHEWFVHHHGHPIADATKKDLQRRLAYRGIRPDTLDNIDATTHHDDGLGVRP
jgi:hypothetical protein